MESALPTSTPYPPTEIWRHIFWFATASQTSYDVDYLPFEQLQESQEITHSLREDRRLQTGTSLVQVSREFHAIAVEFLYEDVRICGARGLQSFFAGLSRSTREDKRHELGKLVRRLELPWRGTSFTPQSQGQPLPFCTHPIPSGSGAIHLVDILHFCPNLEIFVRPSLGLDTRSIILWASLIKKPCMGNLPRLMRLDWHESEVDVEFHGANHTDRLGEIVARAPNLRYFFLSSDRQNSLVDLTLPASLETIRINHSQFQFNDAQKTRANSQQFHYVYLPNFHNLILHTTPSPTLLDFLASSGMQLSTMELAFAPQMGFSSNQMRRLLSRCPRLEEMVYYIGAPEILLLATFQCPSIKRVRLKCNPDEWSPGRSVLSSQTDVLEAFPELEEIILHDPMRWFIRRDSGRNLIRRMLRRGCAISYDDGTSVILPPVDP
ncbi:hypothetical protein C8R43DRAFT_963005 [Mycena crocata]|nr:hypothetical protein C8R43DRAFT_963005 [Mycena crocata]